MRLHDVIFNETPKFQSLNPTSLSQSISVRGDNVEDVLVIPLELHGVVSCFPTFKPTQLEFETCDRYELTYESPEYDPSATTFHEQEDSMMDSWGNLKVSGDFHPKRLQVCSLRQKEAEVKLLSSKYNDTSTKLQDLSSVLDDGTLLAELDDITTNLNISLVKSEMRDKAGVDAATVAKHWGIGIEAAKRVRPVNTQRGIMIMIHPSLTNRYNTNDRQLRYRRLPVTMHNDFRGDTVVVHTTTRTIESSIEHTVWFVLQYVIHRPYCIVIPLFLPFMNRRSKRTLRSANAYVNRLMCSYYFLIKLSNFGLQ
jgi:hypothetical protein